MWSASPVLIAFENRLHLGGQKPAVLSPTTGEKMKSAVTVLFLLLMGIAAYAGAQGDPAEKGKALVESKKCELCHKEGGVGKPVPMLVGTNTDAFLKEAISNPKKAIGPEVRMPQYKFTDEELQAVIVYLRSLAKQ
jgi:cytochrome c2